MPYQHLHIWRLDVCFALAATFFLSLFLVFFFWFISENVSVQLVRYELWICVTWSLKTKPAESVSLVVNLRDERNKGVETEILLLLKKKEKKVTETISVTGGRFFLHLFVFRYFAFPTKVALFTISLSTKSYLCLDSRTEQTHSDMTWLQNHKRWDSRVHFYALSGFFCCFCLVFVNSLFFLSGHCIQ